MEQGIGEFHQGMRIPARGARLRASRGEAGRAALKGYGIAPPAQQAIDISGLRGGVKRTPQPKLEIECPNCGSLHTQLTSQFGSTPCKALYKCLDCREPVDYFKCH